MATKINDNKVLVTHTYSTSRYLYGIICTINGTTITVGTDTKISSGAYSGMYQSPVLLDENTVFISHAYNKDNLYLYGVACTIDGTTITPGTDVQLQNVTESGQYQSATRLSDNRVFVAYSGTTTHYLTGVVCTVNGTSVSKGSAVTLDSVQQGGAYATSPVALNENTVFVGYRYGSSASYACGMVCVINDTTITPGTIIQLTTTKASAVYQSAALLKENVVAMAYSGGTTSTYYLYAMLCRVKGILIEPIDEVQSTNSSGNALAISTVAIQTVQNKAFISCRSTSDTGGSCVQVSYPELAKKVTTTSQEIFGVAKTSGTAGDTIQVYEPNYN